MYTGFEVPTVYQDVTDEQYYNYQDASAAQETPISLKTSKLEQAYLGGIKTVLLHSEANFCKLDYEIILKNHR